MEDPSCPCLVASPSCPVEAASSVAEGGRPSLVGAEGGLVSPSSWRPWTRSCPSFPFAAYALEVALPWEADPSLLEEVQEEEEEKVVLEVRASATYAW